MNEFKASIGGHKLSINDLEWIANSTKEQLSNIVKALIGNSIENKIVLWGCGVSKVGDNYTNEAGAIYYNGEYYTVDALITPLNSTTAVKWSIDITYGVDNPVEYKDGSTHNVHHSRKLKLVDGADSTGEFTYTDASLKKLSDIIKADNKLNSAQDPWHFVGTSGEPAFLNGWNNRYSSTQLLKFMKDQSGNVRIVGIVSKSAGASNPIFQLPVGYRPSNAEGTVQALVYAFDNSSGSGATIFPCAVLNTGQVYLADPILSTYSSYMVHLNISFNIN